MCIHNRCMYTRLVSMIAPRVCWEGFYTSLLNQGLHYVIIVTFHRRLLSLNKPIEIWCVMTSLYFLQVIAFRKIFKLMLNRHIGRPTPRLLSSQNKEYYLFIIVFCFNVTGIIGIGGEVKLMANICMCACGVTDGMFYFCSVTFKVVYFKQQFDS